VFFPRTPNGSPVDDLDTASFTPSLRPFVLIVVANALFALVFLGGPFYRGRLRATGSEERFAAFAACLYGGLPSEAPGLALPEGDRRHFAAQVIEAGPEWPGRCARLLEGIVAEPATLIFPSVKRAEVTARAAVGRVRTELETLERARSRGDRRVPDSTLDAVGRLRAALSLLLEAASVPVDLGRAALRFEAGDGAVPTPSRIPLHTRAGGRWSLVSRDGHLLATAVSGARIATLDLEGRVPTLRTARRGGRFGGFLRDGRELYVLYATPRERCAEGGCRALGVSAFPEEEQRPAVWLHLYPVGEPRHAVTLRGRTLWAVARLGDGAAVRRFTLPASLAVPPMGTDPVTLEPEASWRVVDGEPRMEVLWVDEPGQPVPTFVFTIGQEAGGLRPIDETSRTFGVASPGGASARLAACGRWIAVASTRGSRLSILGDEGEGVDPALALDPPERDRLAVTCGDGVADVFTVDRGVLRRSRCTVEGCAAPQDVVRDVGHFRVHRLSSEATLVLFSGEDRLVRLALLGPDGLGPARIPAPCWRPRGGFCGDAEMLIEDDRWILGARDGADLRLLESRDRGATWGPLPGL
jgi:hypothetical protein